MKLYDEMPADQWAIKAYVVPGIVSMLLALPVTFAALARARRTPWWAVVPALLVLPTFAAFGAAGIGIVVPAGILVGLSVLVFRGTRG
jgi:steroid 5-alpha reductase family enzyme